MPDSPQIGWRAIVYGTPVVGTGGTAIGSVREVLGSDAEDVFHGIRVSIDGHPKDDVVVTVDSVTAMTPDRIDVDMTRAGAIALPRYSEESTYHLASVGWLRKQLRWSRDSKSDEEPG